MGRRKGRILAFQALYAWEAGAVDNTNILQFEWASETLLDRLGDDGLAFSRLIVQGVLDNLQEIDDTISRHLVNWTFSRLNKVDLAILRISSFALMYQKDIASSITIDEAIDISQEYGSEESFKFINGVLGAIQGEIANAKPNKEG